MASNLKVTSNRPRLAADAPEHLRLVAGRPATSGRLTLRVRPGRKVTGR